MTPELYGDPASQSRNEMNSDADRDDQSIRDWFSSSSRHAGGSYRDVCGAVGPGVDGWPGQSNILFGIEEFVSAVVACGMPAFHIETESNGQQVVHPYPLAHYLRYFPEFFSVFGCTHDYSEHIQVFRECCHIHGFLHEKCCGDMPFGVNGVQPDQAIAMNRLIEGIRIAFGSSRYRRIPVDRRYQAACKRESIESYARALLAYYSRLTIIRIDFGYLREFHGLITIDDVYRHLKMLIRAMSASGVFNHKVGYAWAIEQGPDKGYHIHGAFFYAGWEVRTDILKSHEIGQFWVSSITSGMGYYFSCNAKKDEYRRGGIGLL